MAQRPFVYRPRTVEDVLQRAQDNENRPGIFLPSYNIYKVRNGENWIRILPATWDDARHWGFDVFVHGGVGADRATVLCNSRMGNGRCAGCEIRIQEERAGADEATLRQLNATHRTVAWLIDRKAEEEGPQLWAMPYQSVDLEIQARSIDRTNGELYLVDDLEAGYDVTFNKTGKDLATRYVGVELVRHPSAIEQVYFDYVIDHPIPECLIWRSYEQVLEMYTGGMVDPNTPTAAPMARGSALPPRMGGSRPTRTGWTPPAEQQRAPANGPALPARGGIARPGYPPSRAPAQAPAAPAARRPGGWSPPQEAPVDNYRGEQYAVDPNFPPPTGEPAYGEYPPQYEPQYEYDGGQQYEAEPPGEEAPPWNEDPNAINYRNPPQQPQQPQQYQGYIQRPVQPRQQQAPVLPPRRMVAPQQQQQPPQQQRPQLPQRGPAPPPRGNTTAAGTAEQLRQHFGRGQPR